MFKKPGSATHCLKCNTIYVFSYTADPYSTNPTLLGEDDIHWISYFLVDKLLLAHLCFPLPPIIFQIVINISLKEPVMLFIFRSGDYLMYFLLPLRYLKRDFLGGPVVKNPPSNAGDAGSIPGGGTKIPHATGQRRAHAPATKTRRSQK